MNKKTFIMALCMMGHSGYAAPKREGKAQQKEERMLRKQEQGVQQLYPQQQYPQQQYPQQQYPQQQYPQQWYQQQQQQQWYQQQQQQQWYQQQQQWYQQYLEAKQDVKDKMKSLSQVIDQIETWSKELHSLTQKIENSCASSISDEDRQRLWNDVQNQQNQQKSEKKVEQVDQDFAKAYQNYHSSLQNLQNKFNDFFTQDNELRNFLLELEKKKHKILTFNDNKTKFYEKKRWLEAVVNATRERERQNQYQVVKKDVMDKWEMYRERIAEIESGINELQALIENCDKPLTSGEEGRRLENQLKQYEQKMRPVLCNFNEAQRNSISSWEGLCNNFYDYFAGDPYVQDVMHDIEKSYHTINTFHNNRTKFYEKKTELEGKLKATWEQERQNQYQVGKKDVMDKLRKLQYEARKQGIRQKVEVYRTMRRQLEILSGMIQSLTQKIENRCASSISDEDRQRLWNGVKKQEKLEEKVKQAFDKAYQNYDSSLKDLKKNFADCCKGDDEFKSFVSIFNQGKNTKKTVEDNINKRNESKRKLEEALERQKHEARKKKTMRYSIDQLQALSRTNEGENYDTPSTAVTKKFFENEERQ